MHHNECSKCPMTTSDKVRFQCKAAVFLFTLQSSCDDTVRQKPRRPTVTDLRQLLKTQKEIDDSLERCG